MGKLAQYGYPQKGWVQRYDKERRQRMRDKRICWNCQTTLEPEEGLYCISCTQQIALLRRCKGK